MWKMCVIYSVLSFATVNRHFEDNIFLVGVALNGYICFMDSLYTLA